MGRKEYFESIMERGGKYIAEGDLQRARCGFVLAKEMLGWELYKRGDAQRLAEAWKKLGSAYLELSRAAAKRKDTGTEKEGLEGSNTALAIAAALEEKASKRGTLEICVRIAKTSWSESEIEELSKKADAEQENAELWYQLGRAHRLRGEYGPAMEALNKALGISKGDLRILEEAGHVHFQMGEYGKAQRTYDKILSEDPDRVIRLRWKNGSLRYWR